MIEAGKAYMVVWSDKSTTIMWDGSDVDLPENCQAFDESAYRVQLEE